MEILMILLEIFDKVSCSIALIFGICLVPYSIYNSISFIINKICLVVKDVKNTKHIGGYQPKGKFTSDGLTPPKGGSSISKGE